MNGLQRLAAAVAAIAFMSVSPGVAMAQDGPAGKLNVVASFSILGDLAREVGGDRIALRTLVGPDGDAHVHEPSPSDAIAMARADIVLVNGLQFEGFLTRLVQASGATAPIIEATKGLEVIRDPDGGHYHSNGGKAVFHQAPYDPHTWQSVANVRIYVRNIAEAFCAADKDGCDTYNANARAYDGRLTALDDELRAAIAAVPQDRRVVVVAHNAFRYFEAAYGIIFLSPKGVSTGSEASAAAVGSIIQDIREKRAAAVFAENITDTRLVQQIAREAGLQVGGVLYSDALSKPEGPAPTYIDMMRHNVDTIVKAIGRE